MPSRKQRTLLRSAEVRGVGFFTGTDIRMRMHPAPENHGIQFLRTDLPDALPIPATIDHAVQRDRRTAIQRGEAVVELTEHILATFAGLHVDNCLVEIDAPEVPGMDGSALAFADALLGAGFLTQDAERPVFAVGQRHRVAAPDGGSDVVARPLSRPTLAIGYQLDYGPRSPIRPQVLVVEITPETFMKELAFARTFILESEVQALRGSGYGHRVTEKDLLVFGRNGVIGNQLRAVDECARHKILDCLGDFALLGCDLHGYINAYRSGHQLNRDAVRKLKQVRDEPQAESAATSPKAA